MMDTTEVPLRPLDRFLLTIVRYGLFAVFFLPFVVVLNYLYPWVSGKIWGLEITIEVLFPCWVLLAMRRKEYRPAAGAFTYAILGYFAVISLSMFLGDNVHRSFWSKPDRLTGLFFQYHLLAFFLMAASVWRGTALVRAIGVSVLTALVATLQGYYQRLTGSNDRAEASFGNPDYLAQYLVPHVFLALWLFWQERHRLRRSWWLAAAIMILIGILATKSRGALLGLFLSALTATVIAAFKTSGRARRWARFGLLAFALIIGGFFAADRWPPTHEWLYGQRLSVQYLRETSGPRTLLIQNAIKGFKARPLLGWGPENFESAYYYYYDPTTIRFSDYETRQDRPHNLVLELLVDFGVIGFAAYALLFFLGWREALRIADERRVQAAILVLVVVGHLATNLFLFETPTSYVLLFIELACLAAFIAPQPEVGDDSEMAQGAVPAALATAALSIWALWYGVIGTIQGAQHTSRIIVELGNQSPDAERIASDAESLKAIKSPFYERDIRAVISNMSRLDGESNNEAYVPTLRDLTAIEAGMAAKNRNDYVNALVTAVAELNLNPRSPEEQAALEEAVARIQRLAPNRQEVAWITAQMLIEKGDVVGAEVQYRKAVDLDQAAMVSHAHYAAFLAKQGRYDDLMKELHGRWDAISSQPEIASVLNREFLKLFDAKDYASLLKLYQAAVRQGVNAIQFEAAGAYAEAGLGAKNESDNIIDKMRQEYPDKRDLIEKIYAQMPKPELQPRRP